METHTSHLLEETVRVFGRGDYGVISYDAAKVSEVDVVCNCAVPTHLVRTVSGMPTFESAGEQNKISYV
jgi:hypothetical protein